MQFMANKLQGWKSKSSNQNQQNICNSSTFNSCHEFKDYILALE
jgi:hypothetical protein